MTKGEAPSKHLGLANVSSPPPCSLVAASTTLCCPVFPRPRVRALVHNTSLHRLRPSAPVLVVPCVSPYLRRRVPTPVSPISFAPLPHLLALVASLGTSFPALPSRRPSKRSRILVSMSHAVLKYSHAHATTLAPSCVCQARKRAPTMPNRGGVPGVLTIIVAAFRGNSGHDATSVQKRWRSADESGRQCPRCWL